jgi:hypothetical protein
MWKFGMLIYLVEDLKANTPSFLFNGVFKRSGEERILRVGTPFREQK